MSGGGLWIPVFAMVMINFGMATVSVLMKKVLNEGMDHMVIITYRMFVSTIFLAPIAYYWERKTRTKLTFRLGAYHFLGGLVGSTLTQYFMLLGLKHTSAAFASAFANTLPVATFLLAIIFRHEKLDIESKSGRAKVLGAFICVGGTILLTLYKGFPVTNTHQTDMPNHGHTSSLSSDKKTESWVVGSIFFIGGTIVFSSWFLVQARIFKKYPCQFSSTVIMSFFASLQSAILCAITRRNTAIWAVESKMKILAVIYAGVVGSGLCSVALAWCVKRRGPVFSAAFSPFTQIFAALLGVSFLHEGIYFGSIIGSILVVIGLYVLLWGKSKDTKNCVVTQSQSSKEDQNCDVELPVSAAPPSRNP